MKVHAHYPKGETRVQRQAQALLEAGIDVDVDVLCLRGRLAIELTEVGYIGL